MDSLLNLAKSSCEGSSASIPDPMAIELGKIPNDECRKSDLSGFRFFLKKVIFLSSSSEELEIKAIRINLYLKHNLTLGKHAFLNDSLKIKQGPDQNACRP
jgi:hypothetical protein